MTSPLPPLPTGEGNFATGPSPAGRGDGGEVKYVRGFLFLLFVVNLLNYIDRLAISGLLETIRKDFAATDKQMGLVGLAFTLTYSVLPPIFGWLGDRFPRNVVIALSAAFWSIATALTGAARSVTQLVIFRGAVGVGEASYMSNAPNLIADLVPAPKRGSALAWFYIASPVGAALGVMIGGGLASVWGWRAACWLVGLPGLVVAYIVWKTREPVRGGTDNAGLVVPQPLKKVAVALFTNRAFVLLSLAYTGMIFLQNAVEFWLPTILQRDKGLPLLEATQLYGWVLLPSGIIGPLAGSFFADRIFKGSRRAYFGVCGVSTFLTMIPLWAIAATNGKAAISAAVFFEFILAYMSTPLVLALIVTVVSPAIRSTATAVMLMTVHLLGDAISQPLVGRVSTSLEHGTLSGGMIDAMAKLFHTGPDAHLTLAMMMVIMPAAVVSGVIFLLAMPKRADAGGSKG